jgi:DNA-binding LacI/PurR family transcriptional regulator/DNA-binding CsgD family transcriptional regulator
MNRRSLGGRGRGIPSYCVNVYIDNYTDMNLRSKLVLNGIYQSAYQKKTVVRTFFSVGNLVETLSTERDRFVIVLSESRIHSENLLYLFVQNQVHPIFIHTQFPDTAFCFSSVIPNYYSAVYQLTGSILAEFPEPSVFVGFNDDSVTDKMRLDGFRKAANEYNVEYEVASNEGNLNDCLAKVLGDLRSYRNIICANDMIALLLLHKMKATGINPGNFNITGSGNTRTGEFFKPSLTTITSDFSNEGIAAVDAYTFLLKKEHVHSLSLRIESRIILRESTQLRASTARAASGAEIGGDMIDFYGDDSVRGIDALERMLMSCDDRDIGILHGLMRGYTYEKICDLNYLAVNTVKYRINKIEQYLKVRNKAELVDYLRIYELSL